uniref:Ribosomal protein L5 n=1 Tax=Babesia gibsoni TaxID=33632 RepID=A0A6M8NR79_BABGI|nr:ribosomal protein L5 [Babesia gibsoni]
MNYILNKIIIYNYIYNNINYKKESFLSDLTLSIHSITRQFPLYILNKKKEVIGVKTTLRKINLNKFLYKLKKFTLIKLYNTSIFYKNIYNFDKNFNLNIILTNKSYFFEYFNYSIINYIYKFNIKLIFNKYISNIIKINYILNKLNFKL